MSQLNDKKRKRAEDGSPHSHKKVALPKNAERLDSDVSIASVASTLTPKFSLPVIASTAGIQVAQDSRFTAYSRSGTRGRHLMLHSTSHQTLDYTAREDDVSERPLKHYVGIYDPKTRKMQVVEAKKMTVRGTVRAKQAPPEALAPPSFARMVDRRADLTSAFGTKKAKDVIKNDVLNKISTLKDTEKDPASRAIMASIGQAAVKMATEEQLHAATSGAKPVPPPNLEAEEIQDVYDPSVLLGSEILNMVPISDWQDAVAAREAIECSSRFVARRIQRIANGPEPVPRLRLLRYLLWMIGFMQLSRSNGRMGTRKIPPRNKLREALAPAPDAIIDSLRRNFSTEGEMRKFNVDRLMTYACVFALTLENFEMDSLELREDLRLEQKQIDMYFHEVGARTKAVADKSSGKVINRYRAKLALPLHFPKQRVIRQKRR